MFPVCMLVYKLVTILMVRKNILSLQLLYLVCFATVRALYQGERCQLKDGQFATCVHISSCATAQNELALGRRSIICSFDGIYPIVCCRAEDLSRVAITDNTSFPITENPNDIRTQRKSSISEEKCQSYITAKIVTTTTTTPKTPAFQYAFGGQNAFPREFPHMALLGYGNSSKFEWQCGGSLISEEFVLTAAHCINSQGLGGVRTVRLGDLDISTTSDIALPQEFNVSEAYVHPNYVSTSHYHDIGLIKLNRPAIFTDHVKPACLQNEPQLPPNESLTATGWGATTYGGSIHPFLQKIFLFNLPLENCLRTYGPQRQLERGIDGDTQICGGNLQRQVDTCQGDSGGPMQRLEILPDSTKVYRIVGVTSFGKVCGLVPGIYVKVSAYLSWIESIVWPN